MSKYKSTGIHIDRSMIMSEAWRSLSGKALHILIQLLGRRQMESIGREGKKRWRIKNNGEIELPYREVQKLFGVHGSTVTRTIDELIDKGFISISRPGNGTGGGQRSKYALDDRWKRWGKTDFVTVKRAKARREVGFMRRKKATLNSDAKPTGTPDGTSTWMGNSTSSDLMAHETN